jgi:hypothetical protein
MAFDYSIDKRIVGVQFGVPLMVICYQFSANVAKPKFPFSGLPFEGDFDVLDESIEAVLENKPIAFTPPPLVHPISNDMMEKLLIFTAKPPTFNEFTTSSNAGTHTNVIQSGNIYVNLTNIKKVLDKGAKTFTIRATKPSVSGMYSGPGDEELITSTVFSSSPEAAVDEMKAQLAGNSGFLGTYISTEFSNLDPFPGNSTQFSVGLNYFVTPIEKKFAAWQATAYSYKKKVRSFEQGANIAAGNVPPAPKNIDKKTKADGFGTLTDRFEFTINLQTLKFT